MKKKRNVGLDLLRIILAMMVITIHINTSGAGMVLVYTSVSPWQEIIELMTFICFPAVNCYVIMSAYYMSKQDKDIFLVVKSLTKLWLSIIFFSLFGYITISCLASNFNAIELMKRFFSVSRGVWWYITVYFVLVLISPYLNIVIKNIEKKDHKILLGILLMAFSVVPMFLNWESKCGSNYGFSLLWFITLYFTGAYLRYYKFEEAETNNIKFIKYLLLFIMASLISYLSDKTAVRFDFEFTMMPYNSITSYMQSVFLFAAFLHLNINNIFAKPISFIAELSLASYLFHCQEDIEKILWNITRPYEYANSPQIIVVWCSIVGCIMVAGVTLEVIRKKIVSINSFEDKLSDGVANIVRKILGCC